MRRPSLLLDAVLILAVVSGAAACTDRGEPNRAGDERPTTTTTEDPTTTRPSHRAVGLEAAGCPDPTTPTDRFTCRTLVVAEDPSLPEERQVELPVLTLSPASGPVGGAPLVYLHGGPGASAVSRWATWLSLIDGLGRDVVLYDQRGGGAAVPRLDCPEHADAVAEVLSGMASWDVERELVAGALDRCHARLVASGVDLDHYDTPTSTADLEALRRALGVERMTLVGSSYGSRLALDYLRTHPERVESVVLDGVDPPGDGGPERERVLVDAAIERLVRACSREPGCAADHPDLAASVDAAAARLDRTPGELTVPSADGGSSTTVRVGGDELHAGLFAALYDTAIIPLLPSAVARLAEGDDSLLASVGPLLAPALDGGAMGALMSVNCADHGRRALERPGVEGVLATDPGRARLVVLTGSDNFCGEWPVEPVGGEFSELGPDGPGFEVPMLVVVGELDPITPASNGAALASNFGATLVEVPRAGHSPLLTDACALAALTAFLADPGTGPPPCDREPTPFA